jgi:hypothetical protein
MPVQSPDILRIGFPQAEPRSPGVVLDRRVTNLPRPTESSPLGILTPAETTTLPRDFYLRFSADTRVGRHEAARQIATDLRGIRGTENVLRVFEHGITENDLGRRAVDAALNPQAPGAEQFLNWAGSIPLERVAPIHKVVATLDERHDHAAAMDAITVFEQTGLIAPIAEAHLGVLDPAVRDERIQEIFDFADGGVMRAYTRRGVIIDPTYLLDPEYALVSDAKPFTDGDHAKRFATHVASGFYWIGNDHTYLGRNRGEVAKAAARGMDDFAVSRPGNYLYHDLELVHRRKTEEEFPTGLIMEYVLQNYLNGLDAVPNKDLQAGKDAGSIMYTFKDGERVRLELQQYDNFVIPFRALRKSEGDTTFYEYGTDEYVAELVDIAGKIDQIDRDQGLNPSYNPRLQMGKHIATLPQTIKRITPNAELVKTAMRIIGESRGLSPEDAKRFAKTPVEWLKEGEAERRMESALDQYPQQHDVWPALTTSYEWFTRYATEVSPEDIERKGVYNPLEHPFTYANAVPASELDAA